MKQEFAVLSSEHYEDASGRNSVIEGSWATYRQTLVRNICDDAFAYDTENDYIAVTRCDNYDGKLYIPIRENSDWNTLVAEIETELSDVIMLDFSPEGNYLAIVDTNRFELYDTSDWSRAYSDDFSDNDGTTTSYPYDMTWSGDGQRLVISTGSNGGKMYEGPDWAEVQGASSNGYYVTHHPNEDILWYMTDTGSVEKYEMENVPFVGQSWVLQQNYNPENGGIGRLSISPDGSLIVAHPSSYYNQGTVYSSSSFSIEYQLGSRYASFSSTGTHILTEDRYSLKILSTNNWEQTSEIRGWAVDYVYHPYFSFSANDDEIVLLHPENYYNSESSLNSFKPDADSDSVVDELDLCPNTSNNENSDAKGCAPSQKDTDVDGVNDRDDTCPRTTLDTNVNTYGCSEQQLLDLDGDSVSDSDDTCPDTPPNEHSNIYGCSSSQRDVDNDGESDKEDVCPLFDEEPCRSVVSWISSGDEIAGTDDYSQPEWSPNSNLIAAMDSQTVTIFDTDFAVQHLVTVHEPDVYISDFEWMPVGESLILIWIKETNGSNECGYSIYEISDIDNPTHNTISSQCDYIRSFAQSPDGLNIGFSIFSFDTYSGKTITLSSNSGVQIFEDVNYAPYNLLYSHDGTALIGLSQGNVLVWDTNDGYLLRSGSVGYVDSILMTPNGDWFVMTEDFQIHIYSFTTLELQSSITIAINSSEAEYRPNIESLTISRNGEFIHTSVSKRYYDGGWSYIYNNSIHTYQLTENQDVKFITSTVVIPYLFQTAIAPDESMAIVHSQNNNIGFSIHSPDTDGDNLSDEQDLCPFSPLNTNVNQDGCGSGELDDDNDGIANDVDSCRGSQEGFPTDEQGCNDQQVDEDFDGICNQDASSGGPSSCTGEDKCPGTLTGVNIDINGCSWAQQDSDSDGVNNADDQCENTEIPGDADSNGCDRKQRDTDTDSVNDYWDECELTSLGDLTDVNGCSDIQVDSDLDSVCNSGAASYGPSNCTSIDICPNTGANEVVDENGCSWNQKDDDGDGILNKFDQCPETLADSVAPNGCSTWQMDTDGDGVYDANDECANTEVGTIADSKGCSNQQNELNQASTEVESSTNTILALVGLILVVLTILIVLRRKNTEVSTEEAKVGYPDYATRGAMMDGREWIEYPAGSQQRFYRDPSTQQWVHHK